MKKKIELDGFSKTIIILFVIYFIIMVAVFLPSYIEKRGKLYIISNSYKIKYINGKWSNIKDVNEYRMKEFKVFEKSQYKGKYTVSFPGKIYLYDENDKRVKYEGNIVGYRGTFELNVLDYELYNTVTDSDSAIVKEALKEAKIEDVSDYQIKQKVIIDINNDGSDDMIYTVSNNLISDSTTLDGFRTTNDKTIFTLLFMYKNGNIYIIDKKLGDKLSKTFEISQVLDIRNDSKFELLYLDKYAQNDADQCVKLYDLNKNKIIHDFCN